MNRRCLEDCDFCKQTIVCDDNTKHGVDVLRPFNPSFERFLGIKKKYSFVPPEEGWVLTDTTICKKCAKQMANYVKRELCN